MKMITRAVMMMTLSIPLTAISATQPTVKESSLSTYSDEKRGFRFEHPKEWSVEDVKEMGGILLMSPTMEANWQANLFFELRTDKENRTLDVMMNDLIPNLSNTKKTFKLIGKKVITLSSKMQAGQIEYTHTQDGVMLTELEIIVPLAKDRMLMVVASWATSLEKKYRPICNAIVDSINRK